MLHNNTFTFKKINKIASVARNQQQAESQRSAAVNRSDCFSLLTGVYLDTVDGSHAGDSGRARQELQRRHGLRSGLREGSLC